MSPETSLPGSSTNVQVLRDGNRLQARIHGPVDQESASAYWERLAPALQPGCTTLTLDLGGAEYVDSDGIRWLQHLRSELGRRGVKFRVSVREGSRVDRTLKLLKMEEHFTIERYLCEDHAELARVAA